MPQPLINYDELIIKKEQLDLLMDELDRLKAANLDYENDITVLARTTKGVLRLVGLIDPTTNKVYADIVSKERSPMGPILKGLSSTLFTLTKMSAIGKKKESTREMKEKFGFVEEFIPIMEKLDKRNNELVNKQNLLDDTEQQKTLS